MQLLGIEHEEPYMLYTYYCLGRICLGPLIDCLEQRLRQSLKNQRYSLQRSDLYFHFLVLPGHFGMLLVVAAARTIATATEGGTPAANVPAGAAARHHHGCHQHPLHRRHQHQPALLWWFLVVAAAAAEGVVVTSSSSSSLSSFPLPSLSSYPSS